MIKENLKEFYFYTILEGNTDLLYAESHDPQTYLFFIEPACRQPRQLEPASAFSSA
jgi:hypothetical protein